MIAVEAVVSSLISGLIGFLSATAIWAVSLNSRLSKLETKVEAVCTSIKDLRDRVEELAKCSSELESDVAVLKSKIK